MEYDKLLKANQNNKKMIDEYKKNNKKLQEGQTERQFKVIKIIKATEGQSIQLL